MNYAFPENLSFFICVEVGKFNYFGIFPRGDVLRFSRSTHVNFFKSMLQIVVVRLNFTLKKNIRKWNCSESFRVAKHRWCRLCENIHHILKTRGKKWKLGETGNSKFSYECDSVYENKELYYSNNKK